MSAATHVGLPEYLDYVGPEGFDDELIEGEIILSPSPKTMHEQACQRLRRLIVAQGSPQLAIEIFSPGNRPGLLQKKVALYLNTGSSGVYIASPKRQTLVVHGVEGECEYRVGEHLQLPAALPETSVSIQEIFATS